MGIAKPMPDARSLPDPGGRTAEQRELLGRVLRSASFAKTERLSTLLSYVCEMAWRGSADELNEQKLGSAVFGRSAEYDTAVDGIVRTQASRLRQRLDQYFLTEGAGEAVSLSIPKGGYAPVFAPRVAATDEVAPPGWEPGAGAAAREAGAAGTRAGIVASPERPGGREAGGAAHPAPAGRARQWKGGRGLGVGLGLGLLCGLLVGSLLALAAREHAQGAARRAASAHPLWSQIFAAGEATLLVPADSGLVLYHSFDGQAVSLREYLDGGYRGPAPGLGRAPWEQRWSEKKASTANARYTSIVDLEAAAALTHRADAAQSVLNLRYARDVRPNDLKAGNVILLGAREANPWIELYAPALHFDVNNDNGTHVFTVYNRQPRVGEPKQWNSAREDPEQHVYGLIAFTAGLSGDGQALILEGTGMAGTEAAWDFLSNDGKLLPFLKKIERPDGSIPHFQLVLSTRNVSASAAQTEVVASRVDE